MSESNPELAKIIDYIKSHWPSQAKPEWQVKLSEYPLILQKVLNDFTTSATKNHRLIRIAGISGSGKTTQILPAVEAYNHKHHYVPILIAARRFVKYHPHYDEIKSFYGDNQLRQMTDEFSTIMLFLTLKELIKDGYDIVLDVTLLNPEMEAILLKMLNAGNYKMFILMLAVSPTVTEHYLANRKWRHTKETEQEFIRATYQSLKYYSATTPNLRIILWSAYDEPPVYDGPISGCLETFTDYSSRTNLPPTNDDARRDAKIRYLNSAHFK